MRIAIVGGGSLGARTARLLVKRKHEVVVVDEDPELLDALSDTIDCGLIRGDGTRPSVLQELDPKRVDVLLCLTGSDKTNLITGLVARSIGIPRVLTRIEEDDFEHIALELGMTEIVIPGRAISRHLADQVEGHDVLEMSSAIKGDARIFIFVVSKEQALTVGELPLSPQSRISHLYREGELVLPDDATPLVEGDEVVIVTHRKQIDELRSRFARASPPVEP